ncbi:MAG TPA: hypothetical protein PLS53_02325 [Thermoanaerobaculaceae bacterium]|nr:hypothetical protein [Thermoanaerobaculaceae bacterium]
MRPGAVDPGFAPTVTLPDEVYATVVQPDSRIIIAGGFDWVDGRRNRIARLHPDGTLDTSFDPGIGVSGNSFTLALQPDGKVLLGGDFSGINGILRHGIGRLNADGTLDASFDPGAGADRAVRALALQPDGKVLLGGDFSRIDGTTRNCIARLNADGTLDPTFDPGTGGNGSVAVLAPQPDGKVLLGGSFTSINGVARLGVARLNPDGTLDTTFDPAAGANGPVTALAVQPDGKIVLSGDFTSISGMSRNHVARLSADGTVDATFDAGTGARSGARALALQPDGKVLLVGYFFWAADTTRYYSIVRLNDDGSLDTTFKPPSSDTSTYDPRAFALQPDGRILLVGYNFSIGDTKRFGIARLFADGTLDASFAPEVGDVATVALLAVQPDDKILFSGDFTLVNGTPRNGIARLNADGTLDTTFDPGTRERGYRNVLGLALQPDGKVLLGTGVLGGIARLNPDGSADIAFDPGTGANWRVNALALQPDGKVLVAGVFTSINGIARNRIARLNADGSLDATFDPGAGPNGPIIALALQPDGKILLAGSWDLTSIGGIPRNRIARLNANGTLDTTFDPGTGANNWVRALAVQRDGKVLLGGGFTSINSIARNHVARLNADGTLDSAFDPGTGPDEQVFAFALQPDGKVLLIGSFTSINGTARPYLARLNIDGTLDTTFDSGTGPGNVVYAIALQPDGKVLLGGYFFEVDGAPRASMARLYGSPGDGHQARRRLQRTHPVGEVSP